MSELVELKYTRIFEEHQKAKSSDLIIHRGGARSSKTYSIAQDTVCGPFINQPDAGFRCLILRKTLPAVKTSVLVSFKDVLDTIGLRDRITEEKKELNYRYGRSLIHFSGLDDVEKIKCYTPEHGVLTDHGFVPIAEIKVGDLVASLDPRTKKVVYRPVTKTYEYDYSGDVYSPKITKKYSYLSFRVTPEHKLLGFKKINGGSTGYRQGPWELKEVKDIKDREGFFIPRSGIWEGKKQKSFTIPSLDYTEDTTRGSLKYQQPKKWKAQKQGKKTITFETNNFLSFLGWYISEGCLGTEERSEIHISQTKVVSKARLKKVLELFPYKFWELGKEKGYSLSGKELYDYLKPLGKSHEKYIPREILDLDKEHLQHLFDALMDGDGFETDEGRYVYGTTSEQLKDDVCELALKLGFTPTVHEPRTDYPTNFPNGRRFWSISLCKRDYTELMGLQTEHYEGKVYCIEVPPDHNIMIRHGGRTMWCGQSSEWHMIWMEEATDFSYDEYSQLQLRLSAPEIKGFTNKLIMSFNPIDENHWIKTRLLPEEPDAVEIVSTYRDNPFLPEKYRKRIENLIKKDANFARIYRDGEWGLLENTIYNNWKVVDEFPDHIHDIFFGLDFGYNDEMAMIKVGMEDKSDTFWEQEVFYEKETTIEQLVTILPHLMGVHRKKPIYCDSANPDKIKTLRSHGFNAKPCIKGKYSITNGIEFIKTQDIKVVDGSTNLIKEKQSYSWRKDRHGRIFDEPVDYLNHLMDAERYAIITHIKRGGGNVRWLDLLG